jgi:NAD+ kinase
MNLVIVIGGDGFMLQTLKKNKNSKKNFMELIQEIMVF